MLIIRDLKFMEKCVVKLVETFLEYLLVLGLEKSILGKDEQQRLIGAKSSLTSILWL